MLFLRYFSFVLLYQSGFFFWRIQDRLYRPYYLVDNERKQNKRSFTNKGEIFVALLSSYAWKLVFIFIVTNAA